MPLPAKKSGAVETPGAAAAVPVAAAPSEPLLTLSSREVPPGGLAFKIIALAERAPREAWVGPFNSIYDLENEVHRRERANGLPLSSTAVIEDQNCQRLPPGYCRDSRGRRVTRPGALSLSLSDVVSGTKALLGWFRHGSVEEREIVRRTYICNECPQNRPINGCTGCAASRLHSVMNAIVVKPLPSDAVLQSCAICQCSLKAKVRFHLDDLLPHMSDAQRAALPDKCWLVAPVEEQRNDPRV